MIFEIILGLFALGAASAALQAVVSWAKRVVSEIINAMQSFLYATRRVAGAVFQVYTEVRSGNTTQWVQNTRTVSENELPPELRQQRIGKRVQISKL